MITPDGKNFARELTLEYVRQNHMLQCSKEELQQKIIDIIDISNIIAKCILERKASDILL